MPRDLYLVIGALCIALGGTLCALALRKRQAFYVTQSHEDEGDEKPKGSNE